MIVENFIRYIEKCILTSSYVKVETFCDLSFQGFFEMLDRETMTVTLKTVKSYFCKKVSISLPIESIYLIERSAVKIEKKEIDENGKAKEDLFSVVETTRIKAIGKKFKEGGVGFADLSHAFLSE